MEQIFPIRVFYAKNVNKNSKKLVNMVMIISRAGRPFIFEPVHWNISNKLLEKF